MIDFPSIFDVFYYNIIPQNKVVIPHCFETGVLMFDACASAEDRLT
ncbi:MAG TPA: hypothetical protein PKY81_10305 [bacterium]|nr:hypothetical protein [bacterium]